MVTISNEKEKAEQIIEEKKEEKGDEEDDRVYDTTALQDLDTIREFLNESEEIITFVRYEGWLNRVKIVGLTNIRSFGYSKFLNRTKFVSSRRSMSHVEFGDWSIPLWIWATLGLSFLVPLLMMFNPQTTELASGSLFLPILTLIICLIFRKVTYLGTAIGSHFFYIITRKRHLIPDAEIFLKYVHLHPYFGKPHSERYVIPNYFGRWIRRIIIIITILSLLTWLSIYLNVASQSGGI